MKISIKDIIIYALFLTLSIILLAGTIYLYLGISGYEGINWGFYSPVAEQMFFWVPIMVFATIVGIAISLVRLRRVGAISIAGWFAYYPVIFSVVIPMHIYFGGILSLMYLSWAIVVIISPESFKIIDGVVISIPEPIMIIIGIILLMIGLAIYIFSLHDLLCGLLRGEELVTYNLYKYIRHPQYLGILIWTLGAAIVTMRVFSIFSWLTLAYTYILLAEYEEKVLERKLGDTYVEYRNKTFFLLPIPLPRPKLLVRILLYTALYILSMALVIVALKYKIIKLSWFLSIFQ